MVGDFFKKVGGKVADVFQRDKEVIAFPTYGYRKGDGWTIPLRVWVSKARRLPVSDEAVSFDEVVEIFKRDMGELDGEEVVRLRSRVKHFVADDDSREKVTLKFDDNPDGQPRELPGETDENGLIGHNLELSDGEARQLLDAQRSPSGWLSFTVHAGDFEGKGRARLVEPKGLSVISDIDDTIKFTDVPAGKPTVLRNVFARVYETTPGMDERYRAYGDGVMFHYVSGSPWQLYKILGDFLIVESKFPEGAFHMKSVRKNLLRLRESWEDFKNLAAGSEGTHDQKLKQITDIFENLPEREFVLIGDSGEQDPEVFKQIQDKFGTRVRKIFIRDVVDALNKPDPECPKRLEGMAIIDPKGNVVRDVEPIGFGDTRFAD